MQVVHTNMQVNKKTPLIYYFLKIFFPKIQKESCIIAWNDNIYSKKRLPNDMLVHEMVHLRQQKKGKWKHLFKYILSKRFRFDVEFEAYHKQLDYLLAGGMDYYKATERTINQLKRPEYGL